MGHTITHDGSKGIFVALLTNNGEVDVDAMIAYLRETANLVKAEVATDFESVATEINAFLLENTGLRTISESALITAVWDARVERGEMKGKNHDEKVALRNRLEEVLPAYVKSLPDRFHKGRKLGIAIRFVEGDNVKDKEGNPLYDANGGEVQRYRFTEEEWTKLTTPKASATPAAPSSAPAA